MRILTFATTTFLALAATTTAHAHAVLDHAEPRVGSTAPAAPREVVLTFSQNIEPAFSSVEVSDAKGARVDQGKPVISATTMRVGLKPLPPGTYHVRWRVMSVDTHSTEGNFSFQVGK
ncbi:copper resistance CopC family protein [Bradyrhizobium sp.]|uniref:copper resistance CopC family protein n=1 Tax=Bradyrhizobium sp. TaxID=376 RepID=UPI00260A1F36|nr:copper resistance CopC family protein [Bradyrhizobium sp.]